MYAINTVFYRQHPTPEAAGTSQKNNTRSGNSADCASSWWNGMVRSGGASFAVNTQSPGPSKICVSRADKNIHMKPCRTPTTLWRTTLPPTRHAMQFKKRGSGMWTMTRREVSTAGTGK